MTRYSGILGQQDVHQKAEPGASKDIREAFLKLLTERAPASVLWQGLISVSEFKWPEWSHQAFAKERNDWLSLSQLTVNGMEEDVKHWGRFARLAANRIAQGGWKSPLAPIKTLRTSLWVLWLLELQGEQVDWHSMVLQAASWIHAITDPVGGDFFIRAKLHDDCEEIKRWTGNHLAGQNLSREVEALHLALDDYCVVIQRKESRGIDVPWATSAHVDTWEWHIRRNDFSPLSRSLTPSLPIRDLTENFPANLLPKVRGALKTVQYVPISSLGAASWIRAHPQPALFYGPKAAGSLLLSQLYLWWIRYSVLDPLSLLLTAPPIFDGILYALVSCLPESVPDSWKQWKNNWQHSMKLLALSDAWMWLEGAEPMTVKQWLETVLGHPAAAWWALHLKTNPSYAVVGLTLAEQILEECTEPGYEWWGFSRGANIFMLP